MEIVQQQDQRLLGRDVSHEAHDGIEESQLIPRRDRGLDAQLTQFGQKPAQLRLPARAQAFQLVPFDRSPKEVDPGVEGKDLFGLVTAAEHDLGAAPKRNLYQLIKKTCLPNARLAQDHHKLSAPRPGALHCPVQPIQLGRASH